METLFVFFIVHLAMYSQVTNAAWDWIIQKKKTKTKKKTKQNKTKKRKKKRKEKKSKLH